MQASTARGITDSSTAWGGADTGGADSSSRAIANAGRRRPPPMNDTTTMQNTAEPKITIRMSVIRVPRFFWQSVTDFPEGRDILVPERLEYGPNRRER